MGMITITTAGSFGQKSRIVSAMGHGHAHAVAEAIEYLSVELMKEAINLDHKLHEQGQRPEQGFTRP